ncbi:Dimethyl sulfoxide reductase DmsA [Neomoorella glycerini]|uniref:Dimethyl sulfoxide reductase DmsA n=1 Tax=Neomoorella glycerini TaxID=55779 RepID=A0A6I5ZRY2_9FIRM|nr:DMSO/selenate family reductase complex A subunit [Moorella glycerini]QGP92496.1 Dimethyl sulfoxide reductase DmsA [Moorella glycerini]
MAEDTKLWLKPISRRKFLALSAAAAGGAAALATLSWDSKAGAAGGGAAAATEETIIPTSCVHNCGGRCPLNAHVKDGVITWFTSDQEGNDSPDFPQARACLKGRSQRKRLYHPDRLKYPMKRVGKRGEGKFERISWDEALDTIAGELRRIKSTYGNEAIYINYATGIYGQISQSWITPAFGGALKRFLNMFGGFLGYYNTYSTACYSYTAPFTYGTVEGVSPDNLLYSKLIVLFADNSAETRMGGANHHYFLLQAKEKGARIIVVDPRYTDTAVNVADEWIPIRPTTDNALLAALAYVMITENLHDQAFLDKYCLGFDEEHMPPDVPPGNSFKSYILGLGEDRTPKTPAWAEAITGVPRNTIIKLARQIATIKPCCLIQGWGWQRHAYGEQPVRGLPVLAAMTGNIGLKGGGPGLYYGGHGVPVAWMPAGENPVKASIPCFMWTEAIERGHEMTAADGVKGADKLSTDIKVVWNYASNTLVNQHADANRTARILSDEKKCELIIVHDIFLTPSARFADILLPDVTHFEREDIVTFASGIGYAIYHQKVIDPPHECRSLYWVCSELAKRLGFGDRYTEGKTEEDWLRYIVEETRKANPDFPTFEEFRRKGIYKVAPREPIIPYKKQIEDPANNPFKTPSGKIEIFSPRLWAMNNPREIPAIPKYVPAWEGPEDPLKEKYPLQCISPHYKRRVHSTFDNVAWLEEAARQELWINPADAEKRGIRDGDRVKVFNDRGATITYARVTPRILPGVVSLPQGAWWTPDPDGVDTRGCVNVLTKYHPTPLAHGNPQHTNLVQVVKA